MSVNKVIWNKGAQAASGGVHTHTHTRAHTRTAWAELWGNMHKRRKKITKQNSLFLELHVLLAPTQSKCSVFESAWSVRAWPLLRQVGMRERGTGPDVDEEQTSLCCFMITAAAAAAAAAAAEVHGRLSLQRRWRGGGGECEDGEGILQRNPHPASPPPSLLAVC